MSSVAVKSSSNASFDSLVNFAIAQRSSTIEQTSDVGFALGRRLSYVKKNEKSVEVILLNLLSFNDLKGKPEGMYVYELCNVLFEAGYSRQRVNVAVANLKNSGLIAMGHDGIRRYVYIKRSSYQNAIDHLNTLSNKIYSKQVKVLQGILNKVIRFEMVVK